MKTRNLFAFVLVALLALVAVSPVSAGNVQPYEPSGKGTFCAGTGPLVFESVIPGKEWKCDTDGTYTVVQPWHSPGGDYNPKLDIVGLTFEQATSTIESNGWNSGSYWFVPGSAPAKPANPQPSDNGTAPAAPTKSGFADWWSHNWWWLVIVLAVVAVMYFFGPRRK